MKHKVGTILISKDTKSAYKVVEHLDNKYIMLVFHSFSNIWVDSVFKWTEDDVEDWTILPPVLQELYD